MKTKIKTKLADKEKVNSKSIKPTIKKRGLVGAWKGKIKIIGDIDNLFNFSYENIT